MNKMIDYLTLNGLIKRIEPRILHVDSRAVRFRQKDTKSTLRFTVGDISICGDALACKQLHQFPLLAHNFFPSPVAAFFGTAHLPRRASSVKGAALF